MKPFIFALFLSAIFMPVVQAEQQVLYNDIIPTDNPNQEPPEGKCTVVKDKNHKWLYPDPVNYTDNYTVKRTVEGKLYNCRPFRIQSPKLGDFSVTGIASWYGEEMFHGKKSASGITYDQNLPFIASKTLPMGTIVSITNPENGKTRCALTVDRGPFHADRLIDLSFELAKKLGVLKHGTAVLNVTAIGYVPIEHVKKEGFIIPGEC